MVRPNIRARRHLGGANEAQTEWTELLAPLKMAAESLFLEDASILSAEGRAAVASEIGEIIALLAKLQVSLRSSDAAPQQ